MLNQFFTSETFKNAVIGGMIGFEFYRLTNLLFKPKKTEHEEIMDRALAYGSEWLNRKLSEEKKLLNLITKELETARVNLDTKNLMPISPIDVSRTQTENSSEPKSVRTARKNRSSTHENSSTGKASANKERRVSRRKEKNPY